MRMEHCYECATVLAGPICLKCNPLRESRSQIIKSDLKLLCAGVGIGALICSAFASGPASHDCGTLAVTAAGFAVFFHFLGKR